MTLPNVRRFFYLAHLPIFLAIIVSVVYFFDFTAEDAFITYRYSENLITTGSLVYNLGEPINAMTSPLHAILSASLFSVTGQTVLSNKLLALLLLLASALLVWQRSGPHPAWQLLALILALMPPAILLWTFGGLETPFLLFLVTLAVWLTDRKPPFSLTRLCGITFLAGLAFLTRYDSALFFAPLVLYAASKARSVKHVAIALGGAAILPIAWLAVSLTYYSDVLPTSFYVKTPNGSLGNLAWNGIYIASYFVFVGIVPAIALAFIVLRSRHRAIGFLLGHFKNYWWLYIGLALELLYGLTIATVHMMFSFRFFVPYLLATVIIAVDLVRRAAEISAVNWGSLRTVGLLAGFLACLGLFQAWQAAYTYDRSLNGLALVGEYRSIGIRDYRQFMRILRQEALDIERHWQTTGGNMDRRPRILTYAAGILPYTYRDSYIYEKLVSYRHCQQRSEQGRYADYLHILAPRHGSIDRQLPGSDAHYVLISSSEMFFDGSQQEFLVYYNPAPEDNALSPTINEPCQPAGQGALPALP